MTEAFDILKSILIYTQVSLSLVIGIHSMIDNLQLTSIKHPNTKVHLNS